MTPNDAASQLVDAGRSMIAILEEESTALSEVKMDRVRLLQEKKETTAAHYESTLQELAKLPGALDNAASTTRQALSAVRDELDAASLRNINALRAALEMNRRLVQTIASSVERQRISASGYTKTGAASANVPAPASAETVPVSLDETL